MIAYSSNQLIAFWAAVTALATCLIVLGAAAIGYAELKRADAAQQVAQRQADSAEVAATEAQRDRLLARRERALEKAAFLHFQPLDRRDTSINLRAAGDQTYTAVQVKWLMADRLVPLHPPVKLNPNDPGASIELPDPWEWPPTFIITFSDVMNRRFAMNPDGTVSLAIDPTERPEDRKLLDSPSGKGAG